MTMLLLLGLYNTPATLAASHFHQTLPIARRRIGPSLSPFKNQKSTSAATASSTSLLSDQYSIPNNALVQMTSPLLLPRGGASTNNMLNDDYDTENDLVTDDDDDDDELLFGFEDDDNVMEEADFASETTIDRMLVAWKATPPLTKGYLMASFAATLYGYIFCQNNFPSMLLLEWKPLLQRLQIWRLFTGFLNFGPFGLSYLMTAHFVWTYMATLERLNHDRPFDFWIMIAFGQLSMVIGYPILKLSPRFLGHNLSTFLVYIWSRYHEGVEVNMFELFNTRAELLPWFFLAQTFLLEGELPVLDFLGIVFGHIYHHCKTVGILRAPPALTEWYYHSEAAARIRNEYKQISSDFEV